MGNIFSSCQEILKKKKNEKPNNKKGKNIDSSNPIEDDKDIKEYRDFSLIFVIFFFHL